MALRHAHTRSNAEVIKQLPMSMGHVAGAHTKAAILSRVTDGTFGGGGAFSDRMGSATRRSVSSFFLMSPDTSTGSSCLPSCACHRGH